MDQTHARSAPPPAAETVVCYRCGAPLTGDKTVCPACKRSQFRACYCGAMIPKQEAICPHCGADWSDALKSRVRRKAKRRRRQLNMRTMAGYAVVGALVAALLGVMALALIQGLAGYAGRSSQYAETEISGSLLSRASLGLAAVTRDIGAGGARAFGRLKGPAIALLVGAAAGAGYYLWRAELLPGSRRRHHSSRRRSGSRRHSSSHSSSSRGRS